jgi:TonB family protein
MNILREEAKASIYQSFGVQAPQVIDVLDRTIPTTHAQIKGQPTAEATTQVIAASTVSVVTGIASLTDEQTKSLQRYVAAYLGTQNTVPSSLQNDSIERAAATATRQGVELGVEQAFAAHRKRPASYAKIVAGLIGFIAITTIIYLATNSTSGPRDAQGQEQIALSEEAPSARGLNRAVQKLVDEQYIQKGDHWYGMVEKRLIRYYRPKLDTRSVAKLLSQADRLNGFSDVGVVSYRCETFQEWDFEKKAWKDNQPMTTLMAQAFMTMLGSMFGGTSEGSEHDSALAGISPDVSMAFRGIANMAFEIGEGENLPPSIMTIIYTVRMNELRVSAKKRATPPPEEYLTHRLSDRNLKNIRDSQDVVRGVWQSFWIQEPKLASYFISNGRPATEGRNFKAAYYLDLENEARNRGAGIEAQVEWVIAPESTRIWMGAGQAGAWETTRKLDLNSFRPWNGDKGCEVSSDTYWTVENLPPSHAIDSTELVWRFVAQKKKGRWTVTANDGTIFQGGVVKTAGKLGGAVRLSAADVESLTSAAAIAKAEAEAKAAEERRVQERKQAAERAIAERKAREAELEAQRIEAERKRTEEIAIAEAKKKVRDEALTNVLTARTNELADEWAKRAKPIHRPSRSEPGGWRQVQFRPNLYPFGVVAQQFGMSLTELFYVNGYTGTPDAKWANSKAPGPVWVWDKYLPAGQSVKDPEEIKHEQAAKKVLENPPAGKLARPGSWRTYDVQRRDTANKIAASHRMSLREIIEANPGLIKDVITAGQKVWVWDDGSPPSTATAPVVGLKFRALVPLDAAGRWRTAEILAGQAPHEVARARKMTLEAFQAANPHLEEGAKISDGMVVWYWETAEQRAFAEQQRENMARNEEAREEQKKAALAASAATPPVEDREALPKAWAKIKAEPRAWKTDPAFQAEIDARERAIWGLVQTPQPVSSAGSAPGIENIVASNQPKSPTHDRSFFKGAQVHKINQLDAKPALRSKREPSYPFEMRRAGISGRVTVDFIVDANGDVQDAYATESTNAAFEPAALQALRTWKYKPGRKGERDVATHMQITLQFSPGQ